MDKKYFRKIVKNYLNCRKNEESDYKKRYLLNQKNLHYYEKIKNLNNLQNLSITSNQDSELNGLDKIELLEEIKEYSLENIFKIIYETMDDSKKSINETIFHPIEKGDLNAISISESCSNYNIFNDEGSTPLHLCIKNGDTTILKELLKNGAKIDQSNKEGNTLLEYACQLKDPNLISFLVKHGANPKKHIFFREDNKDCKISNNDIDLSNIIKIILKCGATVKLSRFNKIESNNNKNLKIFRKLCNQNIDKNQLVGLGNLKFFDFLPYLEYFFSSLSLDSQKSIIDIISEEFINELSCRINCPENKLEILIINLYPFVEYNFSLQTQSVVISELINSIRYIYVNNNFKLNKNFNKKLMNKLFNDYRSNENSLNFDFIGINISFILNRMKKLFYIDNQQIQLNY